MSRFTYGPILQGKKVSKRVFPTPGAPRDAVINFLDAQEVEGEDAIRSTVQVEAVAPLIVRPTSIYVIVATNAETNGKSAEDYMSSAQHKGSSNVSDLTSVEVVSPIPPELLSTESDTNVVLVSVIEWSDGPTAGGPDDDDPTTEIPPEAVPAAG